MATIVAEDPKRVLHEFSNVIDGCRALGVSLRKCTAEVQEKGNEISAGLAAFVPGFSDFAKEFDVVADALEFQQKSLEKTFSTLEAVNAIKNCEL